MGSIPIYADILNISKYDFPIINCSLIPICCTLVKEFHHKCDDNNIITHVEFTPPRTILGDSEEISGPLIAVVSGIVSSTLSFG